MSTVARNVLFITSRPNLGDFEHLVLLAVMRLADSGYGLAIRNEIALRTVREISTGAVYTTLDRLARKGFVRSTIEQGTLARDNRIRRRYEITPAGREAVRAALRDVARWPAASTFERSTDVAIYVEAMLVRAIAPADLADAIIGDLHETHTALAQTLGEARASAICRGDAVRSLVSLFACGASRALADYWVVALVAAAITCALCVMTIPLWPHIGLGGAGYHALRLALIGLALGCIPRASTLSCLFLLLLIGISDWMIDAHETGSGWHVLAEKHSYLLVLQDGIIMGVDAHPSANGQINSTLIFAKWLAKSEDAVLVPERVAFETACIREIGVFLRESFVDADL